MKTWQLAVQNLTDLEKTRPAGSGRNHAAYNIWEGDSQMIGQALLGTLEKGLGQDFTPAVENAWSTAYHFLAPFVSLAPLT